MAQDFGDDAGERLERGIMRLLGELVRGAWRHHAENKRLAQQQKYYEQRLQQEGTAPETATVAANAMAQREQVCIPFGTQADAAYFAQVCRDNGTYVTALYDQSGKGYIEFAADDLARVQQSVPQFSEVMTQLNNEEIAQTLESAKPLTESQIGELKEITDLPDLPGRDATERDAQSRDEEPDLSSRENPLPNHTEHIAQEVAAARAKCSTFEELQTALAQRGIGTTVTKDGEAMFYEARTDATASSSRSAGTLRVTATGQSGPRLSETGGAWTPRTTRSRTPHLTPATRRRGLSRRSPTAPSMPTGARRTSIRASTHMTGWTPTPEHCALSASRMAPTSPLPRYARNPSRAARPATTTGAATRSTRRQGTCALRASSLSTRAVPPSAKLTSPTR